jgi:hypothetical protein
MTTTSKTLGESFPEEQARVRELLGVYRELGPVGTFGAIILEATLREADEAAISGDVVRMLRAYEALKGCQ